MSPDLGSKLTKICNILDSMLTRLLQLQYMCFDIGRLENISAEICDGWTELLGEQLQYLVGVSQGERTGE